MFTTIVLQPLFNALIFIVNILPNHDLWIALVIITVLFKLILVPAFKKQSKDQIIMQHLAPKMKVMQEKFKDKREDLARETMAMYSKYKINPFTSIFLLLIQLPFLIGLYRIFYYDINSHLNLLYIGVAIPEHINNLFLGINLGEKSILFAVIAGASQYLLGTFMFKQKSEAELKQETEFVRAMNVQMKYFLPIVITVVCAITPAVISLYILVTNLFGIGQEVVIKAPLEKQVKIDLLADK
jgi:YidC/Oxa1 family membrane protein insertase